MNHFSKVILITGGSSGIGKTTGEYLKDKGFEVYGTSRYPENYPNSKITLIKLDITDRKSISNCVSELIKKTGKLDVLINNAGAGITGPIEEIPEEEIKRNFETNFFGPINMIKTVLPTMRNQKSGLIINITSIAGYMGLPFRGPYSSSKGALELISESISMEIKAFNIQITNIAPGDFATNIASGRYHAPVLNDSAYKKIYKYSLDMMNDHVDDGSDPLVLAKAVFKIINSKKPKLHYKVGKFMQKFSIVLKRVLPDRVYENLLMKHYGL